MCVKKFTDCRWDVVDFQNTCYVDFSPVQRTAKMLIYAILTKPCSTPVINATDVEVVSTM